MTSQTFSIFKPPVSKVLVAPLQTVIRFKGRVECLSMQVVMNKNFLLNPEKNLMQIHLVIFEINTLVPKK